MIHYIKRLLTFMISCLKSLFQSKHKDTPILPNAFNSKNKVDDDWNTWEPMTGIKIERKSEEEDKVEDPAQVDFFADMVPEFKQPQQIRIRCNEGGTPPPPNRLGVDTNYNMGSGGTALGDLDESDTGGWEADEETLGDAEIAAVKNEALKQKRVAEREKRRKEKERSSKLS